MSCAKDGSFYSGSNLSNVVSWDEPTRKQIKQFISHSLSWMSDDNLTTPADWHSSVQESGEISSYIFDNIAQPEEANLNIHF